MEIKIITTEIMLMVIVMEMDKIDLTIETIKMDKISLEMEMVKDKTLTNHKDLQIAKEQIEILKI